jgi:hypothetical protein
MAGVPPGRSSSVKTQNKTFILQTEFRVSPKPTIVTSVTLEGRTVHKVERSYIDSWDTEDEFRAAEAAITAQHTGISRKIQVNASDFVRQTDSIKISRTDRLGIIPGVAYVSSIQAKLLEGNPPDIYKQSSKILEIADAVSESSRSGKFKIAAIMSDQGKYLVAMDDMEGILVSLKPDADLGRVLKEADKE